MCTLGPSQGNSQRNRRPNNPSTQGMQDMQLLSDRSIKSKGDCLPTVPVLACRHPRMRDAPRFWVQNTSHFQSLLAQSVKGNLSIGTHFLSHSSCAWLVSNAEAEAELGCWRGQILKCSHSRGVKDKKFVCEEGEVVPGRVKKTFSASYKGALEVFQTGIKWIEKCFWIIHGASDSHATNWITFISAGRHQVVPHRLKQNIDLGRKVNQK
jgi:hypothetical protein